ncbi:MAG: hypothetical protein O2960_28215 [Verrucomicrobia bacterium]|nr:hypothetical protein [Verrucomicrobiota bacterium]
MSERMGPNHYGEERRESEREKAEAIIEVEMRRGRIAEADLQNRPKNDPTKIRAAVKLRRQTTMSVAWIAERLGMGSRYYATNLLQQARNSAK